MGCREDLMSIEERARQEDLFMGIFSRRLDRYMKEKNCSLSELSHKTGIGRETLNRYLRGRTSPKAFNVYLIEKALKISFGTLTGV